MNQNQTRLQALHVFLLIFSSSFIPKATGFSNTDKFVPSSSSSSSLHPFANVSSLPLNLPFRRKLSFLKNPALFQTFTQTPFPQPLHDQPYQPFRPGFEGDSEYDPVESFHKIRRLYLTSSSTTSRTQGRHQNHHHLQRRKLEGSGGVYGELRNGESSNNGRQRCYVCLPPNKGSGEAKDILAMFGDQGRIGDCSDFSEQNSSSFEFNCPAGLGGCILRIHGQNISRACSKHRLNGCTKANSVEFCYCTEPLCNDVKPSPPEPQFSGRGDDEPDGSGDSDQEEEGDPGDLEGYGTAGKNRKAAKHPDKESDLNGPKVSLSSANSNSNFNFNDNNNNGKAIDNDEDSVQDEDVAKLRDHITSSPNASIRNYTDGLCRLIVFSLTFLMLILWNTNRCCLNTR